MEPSVISPQEFLEQVRLVYFPGNAQQLYLLAIEHRDEEGNVMSCLMRPAPAAEAFAFHNSPVTLRYLGGEATEQPAQQHQHQQQIQQSSQRQRQSQAPAPRRDPGNHKPGELETVLDKVFRSYSENIRQETLKEAWRTKGAKILPSRVENLALACCKLFRQGMFRSEEDIQTLVLNDWMQRNAKFLPIHSLAQENAWVYLRQKPDSPAELAFSQELLTYLDQSPLGQDLRALRSSGAWDELRSSLLLLQQKIEKEVLTSWYHNMSDSLGVSPEPNRDGMFLRTIVSNLVDEYRESWKGKISDRILNRIRPILYTLGERKQLEVVVDYPVLLMDLISAHEKRANVAALPR